MNKAVLSVSISVLLALVYLPAIAATSPLLAQTVTLNGIATTLIITPSPPNDFLISAQFRSATFHVGCLSVYHDFTYDLFDANNRIVPISQDSMQHLPPEQSVVNHVVKGQKGHACSDNAPTGVWNARAWFSALYAHLPPGNYTLKIAFAPRGTDQRASFEPAQISIKKI
jgi:hypothetical protein